MTTCKFAIFQVAARYAGNLRSLADKARLALATQGEVPAPVR